MANNQIALLAQTPEFDTPIESQGKALQLRQLMNAGMVQDMDMQTKRQAIADDAATRDVFARNDDPTERIKALYKVSPKAAQAFEKSQADIGETTAKTVHQKAQAIESHGKALAQAFAMHRDQINTVNDPQTAAMWVKSIYDDPMTGPVVGKMGTVEQAIKRIPTDPEGFAKWKLQASLNADEYVKRTVIDANTKANNDTSIATNKATNDRLAAEGNANRANSIKVQTMIGDRQESRADVPPSLTPESLERIARQVMRGDRTGLTGLGKGAQGAANLTAVQNRVTEEAKRQGMTPEQITAASASLEGMRTGMRATGNISARVENAAEEAAQLAPLALEASRQVARSGLLPFGKAQIMFNTQTNDPALAKFATANLGLATAYASAMARGNKPTVSDNEHARGLLAEAQSQPSYEAKVQQMMAEIEAAKRAPRNVRESLTGEISGKGGHGKAPAIPSGWSVKER